MYVSSCGLVDACDVHLCTKKDVAQADLSFPQCSSRLITVKVATKLLSHFFHRLSNEELARRIVLLSGYPESSLVSALDQMQMREFLETQPNIVKWFAQNYSAGFVHPKIVHIPIGLDYNVDGNAAHESRWHPLCPLEIEAEMNAVRNRYALPMGERRVEIYGRFDPFFPWLHQPDIPEKLIFYEPSGTAPPVSWRRQCGYCFVACPRKSGLDTHHFWEALLLGCIPIVIASGLDPLFEDFPVLIVRSWTDITQKLLVNKIAQVEARTSLERARTGEKLLLRHWIKLLEAR
jgi:hypothetical protein